MEATTKIITLDPEREIMPCEPDIYAGLMAAVKEIRKNANGNLVEVSMETHNIMHGNWNRKVVAQQIELKVKIMVDVKEEKK